MLRPTPGSLLRGHTWGTYGAICSNRLNLGQLHAKQVPHLLFSLSGPRNYCGFKRDHLYPQEQHSVQKDPWSSLCPNTSCHPTWRNFLFWLIGTDQGYSLKEFNHYYSSMDSSIWHADEPEKCSCLFPKKKSLLWVSSPNMQFLLSFQFYLGLIFYSSLF